MKKYFKWLKNEGSMKQMLTWISLAILEGAISVYQFINHKYVLGVVFIGIAVMFLIASSKLYCSYVRSNNIEREKDAKKFGI